MDRTLFFTLMAFSFALLLLYLLFLIVSPFLSTLLWAGALGIITYPLFEKLVKRCKGRKNLASLIMTAGVCLILILPLVGLVFSLSQEAAAAYQYLERSNAEGGAAPSWQGLMRHPAVAAVLERVAPLFKTLQIDIDKALLPAAKQGAAQFLNYLAGIAKDLVGFLLKLFMTLVILFFVYRDGKEFTGRFWSVIVMREGLRVEIIGTLERVLAAVMYGVVLTCLVQGALGGLGFWVAGLPSPLLFGTLMAICAVIPVVGTALIWLPGALYLLIQGEVLKGVLLIAWCVVAVSSIDNVIRPIFISGKAKLPILLVALGGLGGLVTMGFTGIIAGPAILAVFLVLFDACGPEGKEATSAPPPGGGDV